MTPPSETARLKLYDEARTVFSAQAADTLMESLPPIPYPDLATKADIEIGLAGLRTELKDDIHTRFDNVNASFARVDANMRTQLYWTIGTMITIFGVLAALIITAV